MTRKRRQAIGASLVAILVLGVATVAYITSTFRVEDEAPISLADMAVHAVVAVELKGEPEADAKFSAAQRWDAVVDEVLWERGDFTVVGGEKAHFDVPQAGATLQLSIPSYLSVEPGPGYVFVVSRAYFADPTLQAEWPWQVRYGLDVTEENEPIKGTPGNLASEIDSIVRGDETRVEAVVAYAAEWSAQLDARAEGKPVPESNRVSQLALDDAAAIEQAFTEWYIGLEDSSRQLPQSLEEIPAQARAALGADKWEPWVIVVRYDDGVSEEMRFVGVQFAGYGLLGPYEMVKGEPVTQIHGVGPTDIGGEFLWWPEGTPQELIYKPEALNADESSQLVVSRRLTLSSADKGSVPLIGAGKWLVDLRAGNALAQPLTDDEYRKIFEELAPPEGDPPRSELEGESQVTQQP
ncbi:MAG: hypothetical protein ABFR89_04635 [Actinomycetota bacterium]